MTVSTFTITQPTQIHFGQGIINSLSTVINDLGGSKPLVVMDPGLVKAGQDSAVTGPLTEAGVDYVLYDNVDPEPGLKLADQGAKTAKENNCDCVIGVGGGSAMDVAKAISILLTNGGNHGVHFQNAFVAFN